MGRFKAVIRLIRERLEALSLRKGIAALCILTAVTMFSFAAPFALDYSYAETTVVNSAQAEDPNNEAQGATPSGGESGSGENSQTAGEGEGATTTNLAEKLETLIRDLDGKATVTKNKEGNGIELISMNDASNTLIILSNADPRLYQDAEIRFKSTGGKADLTGNVGGLTFQGLGGTLENGDVVSFNGKLLAAGESLKLNRPLFNSVTLKAGDEYSFKIDWVAGQQKEAIFASKIVVSDNSESPSKLSIVAAPQKNTSGEYVIDAPIANTVEGNIELNAQFDVNNDNLKDFWIRIKANDDAGILVNSMINGVLTASVKGLDCGNIRVSAVNGNAGLLIGRIEKNNDNNCGFVFAKDSSISLQDTDNHAYVTANESAGGLIGCAKKAYVSLYESIDLTLLNVRGANAGGLIGYFQSDNQSQSITTVNDKRITPSSTVGAREATLDTKTISSQYSGGLFGIYKTSAKVKLETKNIDVTKLCTLTAADTTGNAGGLFGCVSLEEESSIEIGDDGTSQQVTSELSSNADIVSYGGIAGVIEGDSSSLDSSMKINNMTITSSSIGQASYKSGVVAMLGKESAPVAVEVTGAEVSFAYPGVKDTKLNTFGGVAGIVESGSVLYAKNIKVSNTDSVINAGGGIAGVAKAKSVIRLGRSTDLSETSMPDSYDGNRIGLLVGEQDCSLVYADGDGSTEDKWLYIRSNAEFDDIGNYGQVYRLGENNIIIMDNSYNVSLGELAEISENRITINNVRDAARLSITLQSEGCFNGYNIENWADLLKCDINIGNDINLIGTGITGFTRDSNFGEEREYTGNIIGNEHTISLGIGKAYGCVSELFTASAEDNGPGSGLVYRHNRLGLFGILNGSVSDLTIDGEILFDARIKNGIAAGGLAALKKGGANSEISGCLFQEKIEYSSVGKQCYVGGVYGILKGTATNKVMFKSNTDSSKKTKVAPNIVMNSTSKATDVSGGVIGLVDGDCPADIEADGLEIGAIIQNNGDSSIEKCFSGGFIGVIQPYNLGSDKSNFGGYSQRNETYVDIIIKDLNLLGTLSLTLNATEATGGLLGYMWADTRVQIERESSDHAALSAENPKLIANTKSAGGLVYRASGKWKIGNNGINLGSAEFNGVTDSFGLLVCHGETNTEPVSGDVQSGALYLELSSHWGSAYIIEKVKFDGNFKPSVFDEFMAYSIKTNAFTNYTNGIISLRTSSTGAEGPSVIMDGENINTYINRTKYAIDKSISSNQYARYYYNLDDVREKIKSDANNRIDKPEELLLWSVCLHAEKKIRDSFLIAGDSTETSSALIGGDQETSFDMRGFSYYPVSLNNINVEIRNSTFIFYNNEIETVESENNNKLTRTSSQHLAMHCGLFRDFASRSEDKDNQGSYTIKCNGVKAEGTIGFYSSNSSGLLLSGTVKGFSLQGASSKYSVNMNDCNFSNLNVDGINTVSDNECAPLLIRKADSYSELFINTLEVSNCAATNLIGDVGSSNSTQLVVNFSKVKIDSLIGDVKTNFTRSSLLNSFQYSVDGVASAIYNFTKNDDKVTYGKEINGSREYGDSLQWYYYDDSELVTDGNVKANEPNSFDIYLPYVYKHYDEAKCYHEIKVNQKYADIIDGCGTYFDPYVITNEKQFITVSDFINKGSLGSGTQIVISSNLRDSCKSMGEGDSSIAEHVEYTCNGSTWTSGSKVISNKTMHRYMQSAYYDIKNNLDLTNFSGIGNSSNPFRGVLISSNRSTITLTQENRSIQGLIPCSYGSVIKDLTIEYKGKNKLEYKEMKVSNKLSETDLSPHTYFGGVFGLILGGDNIINNVKVNLYNNENPFVISCSDPEKQHLVPIGGYVGAISGGGVIFRKMGEDGNYKGITEVDCLGEGLNPRDPENVNSEEGKKAARKSLYVNPLIGRVISGYAFSEGCEVNNNNKNYKVCKLEQEDPNNHGVVSQNVHNTTPIETTVKTGQGLMVLSAIIQSGAGAGHINDGSSNTESNLQGTKPYLGGNTETDNYCFGNDGYGKVRNASYEYIGAIDKDGAKEDYENSIKDDTRAPGLSDKKYTNITGVHGTGFDVLNKNDQYVNSPYLVRNYATPQTEFVCASNISLMSLRFEKDAVIDVSEYGNAYTGLSGRYISNAIAATQSVNASIDRVIPFVIDIRGNGATIKVNNNFSEYSDDDYNAPGAGALFSSLYWGYDREKADESLSDNDYCLVNSLSVENSNISIRYYNKEGDDITYQNGVNTIGSSGGGLFGNVSINIDKVSKYYAALFENVNVKQTNVDGFKASGSIAGSMGYRDKTFCANSRTIGNENGSLSYTLLNCKYERNSIIGRDFAGGYIGIAKQYTASGKDTINSHYNGLIVSDNTVAGSDSIIETKTSGGVAGGVVGDQKGRIEVNLSNYELKRSDGEVYKTIESAADEVRFENIVVKTSDGSAGGIVGNISAPDNKLFYNDLSVNNVSICSLDREDTEVKEKSELRGKHVGGICGVVGRSGYNNYRNSVISHCSVTNTDLIAQAEYYTGGIVGMLDNPKISGSVFSIIDTKVSDCSFPEGRRAGGIVGNIENDSQKLIFRNVSSIRNTFKGNNSAGLLNISRGDVQGCNVLIADNRFSGTTGDVGLIVSYKVSGTNRFAGISIRRQAEESINKLIGKDGNSDGKSYYAFADYKNTSVEDTDITKKTVLGTEMEYPYVTTMPISKYSVMDSSETEGDYYLFGDSIGTIDEKGKAKVTASEIISDAKDTSLSTTRYKYNRADTTFNTDNLISTYNGNNTGYPDGIADTDIPVLRITGGDVSGIKTYLDIITNSGYSDALKNNTNNENEAHVKAEVAVYKWNNDLKKYIKSDKPDEQASLLVNNNGTKNMSFKVTTAYDNDKGRFTLLTVTFREAGGEYKIHVPVLVRRILEIDFTASLNYGTVFSSEDYKGLGAGDHVLESFGNPVTALVTYKYNSAYKEQTEYGWDTYLAAGGQMQAAEKTITFNKGDLPAGTMLSLVDCSDGKVYTAEYGGTKKIALEAFKDTAGNKYSNKWLSTLMNVTATRDDQNGTWVNCLEKDATVRAFDTDEGTKADESTRGFFRPADEKRDDVNVPRFTLSSEKNDNGQEIQPEENYYLVINVPLNEVTKDKSANGYIAGEVKCGLVPINMNYTLRPEEEIKDVQENTASTYSFLSGYDQIIIDNSPDRETGKDITKRNPVSVEGRSGRAVNINVEDTISFNKEQKYYPNKDLLYYRLDTSLSQYDSGNQTTTGFAANGTSGNVKFYVSIGNQFYKYYNGSWVVASENEPATSYDWKATDENKGELKLKLADSSGNGIDLSQIREYAKNSNESSFVIRTEMQVYMSDDAVQKSIMGSLDDGETKYTQMIYKGILSVREEALDYSSTTKSKNGAVGYYRSDWGDSTIAYSANDIKQLGINCLDLETADGNISSTGIYSLEDVNNAQTLINNQAVRIEYTLKLMKKRENTQSDYYEVNASDYLSDVSSSSLGKPIIDGNVFKWTDFKDGDGFFTTSDARSELNKRFTIPIHVKVNTSKADFSNYRLVLSVKMYDAEGKVIDDPYKASLKGSKATFNRSTKVEDHMDYITYTMTKIAIDGLIEDSTN